MKTPPIAWAIAGNDSGGGAGLSADQRAMAAFGVHACPVVATVTAQNSQSLTHWHAVPPAWLQQQCEALAADMPPQAIKTGMIASPEHWAYLAHTLDTLREKQSVPWIIDPVLKASTGTHWDNAALLQALRTHALPRASVITPNRAEAAQLLGWPALQTPDDVVTAAQALRAMGAQAVVITGGDHATAHSLDYLDSPHAQGWLSVPTVPTRHTHGTGCTFASSLAAAMALGFVAADAAVWAKMATTHALQHSYEAGHGAGPLLPSAAFSSQRACFPRLTLDPSLSTTTDAFAPLPPTPLGLYAIVDSAEWVRRVLNAGVRTVQLRIKNPHQTGLENEVRTSQALCRQAQAQFYLNDHWQLALKLGVDGVHLGQEDLASADLSALQAAGVRLGISTHSAWEMARALTLRPSYVAVGPVHATLSKDMPWLPQGNANVAYWSQLLDTPVVAIAGMNPARAQTAAEAGASGIALISGLTQAADPHAAVQVFQSHIARGWAMPRAAAPHLPTSTLTSGHHG